MAKKKATRSTGRAKAANGGKPLPTIKKWGLFRGSGKYARTQTGIKSSEKIVPAALMLVALAAVTPVLGAQIANSVRTVPIVAPLASTLVGYGAGLRARFGMR